MILWRRSKKLRNNQIKKKCCGESLLVLHRIMVMVILTAMVMVVTWRMTMGTITVIAIIMVAMATTDIKKYLPLKNHHSMKNKPSYQSKSSKTSAKTSKTLKI